MKLLNQSLFYLTIPIFVVITIWAFVFYYNMLDEIYDSIDDGLDNYKLLIIQKAQRDSSIFLNTEFDESNYAIREVGKTAALVSTEVYSDTSMYMLNENEMEPVRMLTTTFRHHDKYYQLKVISSMVEEDDQIENLTRSAIFLYVFLLLSILFVNNVVLRNLWKPFYELLDRLKKFRIDKDKTAPKIVTNTKEFQELEKATRTLIDHSIFAFDKQKQFTENAAHELQTPLAIITNKLELLLEESNLTDKNAATISKVLQTTNRLIKYNKSLLLLSKIENQQIFENQIIFINEVIQQIITELHEFAQFKNIDIKVVTNHQLNVEMDAQLANILLSNLIRNAIFHNVKNGQVNIQINQRSLWVGNTSSATQGLDTTKIFERYYRVQYSSKRQSNGLGLPIVKAICNLYDFEIDYHFAAPSHIFQIKF